MSSSITTGPYVLNKDVDPKRLGSENNAMKETQQLTLNDTARIAAAALAVASCVFIFRELRILRLPEIRPIPWF